MLLDHLGIDSLFAVAGGSMGGMQVLQWAASYPKRVYCALPIACATRHSAQNIAFHEVGRQAIMADPEWRGGRYLLEDSNPRRGLAVARMGAHITYLSDAALHRKFGRKFQDRANPTCSSSASTPIPISISPAQWTISIWPQTAMAYWPKPSGEHPRVSA
jgi:homoserine O-acetyltransferase